MLAGKSFSIYNFTNTNLVVNAIENESSGILDWYIDPWNLSLPLVMPSIDTVPLTVKINTPVNNQVADILVDTLDILSQYGIRQVIIKATVAGRWTGISSSDWDTASNWSDGLVPASVTDIYIPSDVPHWPILNRNLVIGETCGNITLEGSSQLTVTGAISINPGKKLEIRSGAAVIQMTVRL